MCFNSSKSQASASTTTTTTSRDERLAVGGDGVIIDAKDGAALDALLLAASGGEESINFAVGPDGSLVYEDVSAEVLEAVFDFAEGVTEGAGDFARETQGQFAASYTEDLKEVISDLIKYGALALGGYFLLKAVNA